MFGFACICKSLKENGNFKTTTIAHSSKLSEEERLKKLKSISVDNLYNTLQIIKWCSENGIGLYRMTSGLIPLATYYKDWKWYEDADVLRFCNDIKAFAEQNDMRLTMHPDQFCIINSIKKEVVASSVEILEHHNRMSNLLGSKILVIHTGSTAGGKPEAKKRFIENFKKLDSDIKSKIILENDDKSFSIGDVLEICELLHIPVVPDLHHHKCYSQGEDIMSLRKRILATWKDRKPKLHLSSGKTSPTDKHHSNFLDFEDYKNALPFIGEEFDCMLECKEKDLAVLDLRDRIRKELST